MLDIEQRMMLCKAIDIAAGYLVCAGYEESCARTRATRHIGLLFRQGERRCLVLANRAIEQIERQTRLANEQGVIDVTDIFSWPA